MAGNTKGIEMLQDKDRLVRVLRSIADTVENASYADELDYDFTFDQLDSEYKNSASGNCVKHSNITNVNMRMSFDLYGKKKHWQRFSPYCGE